MNTTIRHMMVATVPTCGSSNPARAPIPVVAEGHLPDGDHQPPGRRHGRALIAGGFVCRAVRAEPEEASTVVGASAPE